MEKGSFQGTYIWKSFVHRKFDVYSMEYRVRADSQRCSKVVENVVSCFCLEAVPRDLLWCTLIPAVALFAIFCNPGLIEEFSHFQSCFGAIIYISLIWYLIMLCDTDLLESLIMGLKGRRIGMTFTGIYQATERLRRKWTELDGEEALRWAWQKSHLLCHAKLALGTIYRSLI